MEKQEINWVALSLFGLVVGLVIVWLIRKNLRDKKNLERQLDHEQSVRSKPGNNEIESDTNNE